MNRTHATLHKVVVLENVVVRVQVDLGEDLGRAELGLARGLGLARIRAKLAREMAKPERNKQWKGIAEAQKPCGRERKVWRMADMLLAHRSALPFTRPTGMA